MTHAYGRPPGPRTEPPKALIDRINRLRRVSSGHPDDVARSEAYRDVLRGYRAAVASRRIPGKRWRRPVGEALGFLGGQADRHTSTLADYDHDRYGPFLGVSDEGSAAVAVRKAALASPKTQTLGQRATPLTVGVALDAERLGGVGEVPVGPDEFAEIWSECVGRTLMTTNVGSRVNLRLYRRAPLVVIPPGNPRHALEVTKVALAAAFKPFLEAPGEPRALFVAVEFALGSRRPVSVQRALLRSLQTYLRTGGIAIPRLHRLRLNVRIGWGPKGRDTALRAIDLAQAVGIGQVSIDGVVLKSADSALSLPSLLNYLTPEFLSEVLQHARTKGVEVRPVNEVDADTVAREIWSALNTARAMGLDLGKYGLVPLTLEECDRVVELVQQWFPDWAAAPVFYVDQGIVSKTRVYTGKETARGIAAWLRVVAKHKVRVVLLDTVDKAQSWRILKTAGDPKGLLTATEIANLSKLGRELGIRVLWAGGITIDHAYELGKLGVFGIYVTTAASEAAPVGDAYKRDPAVAAEKEPTAAGVLKVKTVLEGGFLSARFETSSRGRNRFEGLRRKIAAAGGDPEKLSGILPGAWRAWWRWGAT